MTIFFISRRVFLAAAASAGGLAGISTAHADATLPRGPTTLVVPFAAGGATDVVGRLVAKALSERLGQPVVVENVSGAGGATGAGRIARGKPGGSVLLMGTVATHAINPLMMKNPLYDPVKDFTPVSLIATVPNVLIVNPKLPVNTVEELIALLKKEPGKYSYASSGNGTPTHLSGELFKIQAGVEMEHIPYRGGGPAMNDLVGGQVMIMFDVPSGASGFVRSGAVKALGITTKTRSTAFPDLRTVAEQGLPDYETYTWNAVFAPPGMSPDLATRLSKELQAVVADPEIQRRFAELSAVPVGSTPDELATQVKAELGKWAPVVDKAGLKT
ncbi:Bug family tripartite tricarboxylate transporter substrate binding protein [Xanthobacter versatilis]|uniref:Bug family tripartite tricarboxylate transporter substrate binding protein n=1 Tax=Xanthobacter autotrophicus (strain ATCC BAA-1158 / Py2) TaxID=78245 RepID=UPI00372BBCB7